MAGRSRPTASGVVVADFVLDSSVVLAVLKQEPGDDAVAHYATGAMMSSVTLAEIVTKCVERAISVGAALEFVSGSNIEIVDFTEEHTVLTGLLQQRAKKGVLSLGDRACIATATLAKATAVTADRVWTTLELGCPVELIR